MSSAVVQKKRSNSKKLSNQTPAKRVKSVSVEEKKRIPLARRYAVTDAELTNLCRAVTQAKTIDEAMAALSHLDAQIAAGISRRQEKLRAELMMEPGPLVRRAYHPLPGLSQSDPKPNRVPREPSEFKYPADPRELVGKPLFGLANTVVESVEYLNLKL